VNTPNPAIVTQAGARRFPRWALILLCIAYALTGFVGRDAWKSADMTGLGYMVELALGNASWFAPTLMQTPAENPALLPYWLGAWAIQLAPSGLSADIAARIPFILLSLLTMVSTWYGTYYLARSPKAQPVPFAFGGEALPTDYARAIADGGLLALMACLGLAQLAHETTPALAQLAFSSLFFYAMGALPYRRIAPAIGAIVGLVGLTLSGAPSLAVLFGLGGATLHFLDRSQESQESEHVLSIAWESGAIVFITLAVAALAVVTGLWRWKVQTPHASWADWSGFLQLLIWFTWPAWPLALWTTWRWRRQLWSRTISRHVVMPGWFVMVCVGAAFVSSPSDRTLLLALPALATLAAFALPTLRREVAALIDWFTLLFFSGCGFIIWVIWIAMQTGFPAQPAANVARLAPEFKASFSPLVLGVAVLATLAWVWLVRWRVGRHRAAIWRSLVLPAGGALLCWLLLMTLWMPLLNHTLSYTALVRKTTDQAGAAECFEVFALGQGQIAAYQLYGNLPLKPMQASPVCPWLLAEPNPDMSAPEPINQALWQLQDVVRHPADRDEIVMLFKRK
jgi:4-amino-4-deoxy-L-arabinose transferase-like glycosyltransferase